MKNVFFILLASLPLFISAQQTEGRIIYTETVQLKLDIPEEDRQLIGSLPTSQSVTKALYFTAEESLYKEYGVSEDQTFEAGSEDDDVQIKIVIASPESFFYKNLDTEKKVEQREFMGKNFLIKDGLETFKWKLGKEQKVILNYPCMKAVFQDSTHNIVAWFTTQIPVSNGPEAYGQLPGMILELDIDDGDRTYLAQEVVFEKPAAENLKEPRKGKKVNQAEFEAIVERKTKEMEEEMGGEGMMIKFRN